jgi:hypothetical protein
MALVVTERSIGGGARSMVTLTGTEAQIADSLVAGTGLSAEKYRWNGDPKRILSGSGVVGAISVCYVAPVKFG